MCRHAAYLGPSINLEQFLLRPSHGLMRQSYRPNEMLTAEVNADGFGFGWYLEDGTPRRYNNPAPIWSDPNIVQLGSALESKTWLGNVRSATVAHSPALPNTPPYGVGPLLFSHNGFIEEFTTKVRPKIRQYLDPKIEADVHGNTDSEYLFAVIRQMLWETNDMIAVFRRLFEQLRLWMEGGGGSFNFLILDGERVFATRYAVGQESPTLYLGRDEIDFPDGSLVASEPFGETGEWIPVASDHAVIFSFGSSPEQIVL